MQFTNLLLTFASLLAFTSAVATPVQAREAEVEGTYTPASILSKLFPPLSTPTNTHTAAPIFARSGCGGPCSSSSDCRPGCTINAICVQSKVCFPSLWWKRRADLSVFSASKFVKLASRGMME